MSRGEEWGLILGGAWCGMCVAFVLVGVLNEYRIARKIRRLQAEWAKVDVFKETA